MAKRKGRRDTLPMSLLNPDPLASTTPRRGKKGSPPKPPRALAVKEKPARRLVRVEELGPRGYVAGGRRPAADLMDVAPVKVTAYLAPEQLERLRELVIDRQRSGRRADVSMLLREAIEKAFPSS